MYTLEYFKHLIENIPFNKFCESLLETEDKKCILGWLGVQDCKDTKWYNINAIKAAEDLNYLFVKHLYPVLKAKKVLFNTLLLEQGKIVFGINDNDLLICTSLGINHKTIKGRLLQAIKKIDEIIKSEKLLNDAMNAEQADFRIID